MYTKYNQALSYLKTLYELPRPENITKKNNPEFYIKRVRHFLNLINNPQNNFKFIHITGTCGKGSTCLFIHSILNEQKIKAGLFTSPHITTEIERIKVGEKFISTESFVSILNYLKPYIEELNNNTNYGYPSYFEILFAISLLYFKKQKCKYIILEAGIGGKYDLTNIISKSEICIITNIGLDHVNILGKTLTKIARDKSGIIKPNSYFITSESKLKINEIFQKKCKKNNIDYICINDKIKKIHFTLNKIDFEYQNQNFYIKTKNKNQVSNAGVAIEVAKKLNIPNKQIQLGLANTQLPCRFEIVKEKPIVILDGAHNQYKMKSTLNSLKQTKYNKLITIFWIKKNKDIKKTITKLITLSDYVIITCPNYDKDLEYLKKIKEITISINKNIKIDILKQPIIALDKALSITSDNDCILITGSFYLTGELRERWYSKNHILKNRSLY